MPARRTGLPLALALALTACTGDREHEDAETEEAARIEVAQAAPARFGERFVLTGTFTADRSTQLSPRVDGLVARVHVDAGHSVRAGDVLLELDPAVGEQTLQRTRAEAAEAAASLAEAERLYAQAERLGAAQYIAETQIDAREAEVRLARAALESARAATREQAELLERHVLPAPFDGVIAEKLTEVGEWVARSTPVLTLVAVDRVRLDLRVPQERYADIGDGVEIEVHADALGGDPLPARIGAKVPVTDPNARTFLLRVLVEDPQGRLLPGASARAEIALPVREPAIAVPRDALLRQPDGGYSLFVVEEAGDGLTARQRSVRVLRDQGDRVAVAEGVTEGERVVVRGNESLQDGQPVRLAER